MSDKSVHVTYLQKRFELDIDPAVFSANELDMLAKYGTWLGALESGALQPISNEQEHFLAVSAEKAEPRNAIEAVWLKYRRRKQALAEMRGTPHYDLRDPRQTWYSDESYRRGIHFPRRAR
jgi:uncharacterized protein YifE (UPF0438 family)